MGHSSKVSKLRAYLTITNNRNYVQLQITKTHNSISYFSSTGLGITRKPVLLFSVEYSQIIRHCFSYNIIRGKGKLNDIVEFFVTAFGMIY